MTPQETELLSKVAAVFRAHREEILTNWYAALDAYIHLEKEEGRYYRLGFAKLLDAFVLYLGNGDAEGYFAQNEIIAQIVAGNDVAYDKFIHAFHLFEESYGDIVAANVDRSKLTQHLVAVDLVHHRTIAIFSQAYFDIHDQTVFALAKLAELRDQETGQHLERTREYSVLLAEGIKLPPRVVTEIYRVGPLHDIGKAGVPDSILLKPGPLTVAEYETMKKHTRIGSQTILQVIGNNKVSQGYLFTANEIILHHHERYDGSGYPDGLKGEQIPAPARIFALADAYDAITSRRPYKAALPHEEAMERITRDAGKHFDPAMVEAFTKRERMFAEVKERMQ